MPRACPVDRQMLCARTARQAAWRAMRCRALTQLCTVREQWDTSSGLPVKSQTALYLLLGSHRHAQALAGSGGPQRRRSQHRPDQFAPLGHAKTVLNIGHFGACLAIFHSVCQKGTGGKCLNIRKHRVSIRVHRNAHGCVDFSVGAYCHGSYVDFIMLRGLSASMAIRDPGINNTWRFSHRPVSTSADAWHAFGTIWLTCRACGAASVAPCQYVQGFVGFIGNTCYWHHQHLTLFSQTCQHVC